MGLNDRVKEAPELFGAPDMRSLILQSIDKRVGKNLTCNLLREANNFDVICDKSLSSENNTRGGSFMLSKDVRKHLRMSRGEWINIPLKALKDLGQEKTPGYPSLPAGLKMFCLGMLTFGIGSILVKLFYDKNRTSNKIYYTKD